MCLTKEAAVLERLQRPAALSGLASPCANREDEHEGGSLVPGLSLWQRCSTSKHTEKEQR